MAQTSNEGYRVRVRELPSSERPRERLRDLGAAALTNAELLAIILRTGSARQDVLSLAQSLLVRHGGLGGLSRLSFADLLQEPGLGEAKASELQALFQLSLRLATLETQEKPVIKSPHDVYALLGPEMSTLEQEHLRVIMVTTRNQIIGMREVYIGNVRASLVRPAEVFKDAIRNNAPCIILVHNHPSGDTIPSGEDILLTRQIIRAGRLLDVEVLDHLIIGDRKFLSLKSLPSWPTE